MSKKLTHEEFIARVIDKNEHVWNGEIEILGMYDGNKKPIECRCAIHNIIWYPTPHDLLDGCGCNKCGHERVAQKISLTHDEFVKRVKEINCEFTVVGKYTNYDTNVDIRCKNGHIWSANPRNLLSNYAGCPFCAGVSILIGFNDLATVRPDVAKMLKNQDDGKRFTYGLNEKVEFICPQCGSIVKARIKHVCRRGLSCHYCADGVSYPNKFGRAFLRQLPILNYESEYSPEWLRPYSYDNYFEFNKVKYVLEMDGGLGHGHKMYKSNKKDTIGIERDRIKDLLAEKHDIIVIRIDCLESDMDYIKDNILKSALSNIFDLSYIDWIECEEVAQHSLVKDACDLYMSGVKRTEDVGKALGIHPATARRYLQRGVKLGLCDFNPNNSPIPIALVDVDENIIMTFKSSRECVDKIRELYDIIINRRKLKVFCESKQPYKGLNFRLI